MVHDTGRNFGIQNDPAYFKNTVVQLHFEICLPDYMLPSGVSPYLPASGVLH
jgi:hypothetical protein